MSFCIIVRVKMHEILFTTEIMLNLYFIAISFVYSINEENKPTFRRFSDIILQTDKNENKNLFLGGVIKASVEQCRSFRYPVEIVLTGPSGELHSPDDNDDGFYDPYISCRWIIEVAVGKLVELKFTRMDIMDYSEVYSEVGNVITECNDYVLVIVFKNQITVLIGLTSFNSNKENAFYCQNYLGIQLTKTKENQQTQRCTTRYNFILRTITQKQNDQNCPPFF